MRVYLMKFRIYLLAMVLGFIEFSSLALGADLWHLLDEETGNTLAYIYRDGDNVDLYSAAWKKQPGENSDPDKEIEFSYYSSGNLRILIHCKIVADKPEGYWVLIHPQARTKKTFKLQRIEVPGEWMPWKVLRERDNQVLDVFGSLKAKADTMSREEFGDYWIKAVEPEYYAVFTLILYKDKGFGFSEEERKNKAGLVYDSLKEAPDIDLGATYRQVLSDITSKYSWFKLEKGILFFPSLDNPSVTQFTLEKLTPRLVLNTSAIFGNYSPARFRYYLAQSLMYDFFQQNTSLGGGSGAEDYILVSVSLYLISDLGYGEPADYLFLEDKSALDGIKARYHETRKNFMKETKGGQAWRRAKGEKLSEYYYLAYQFGGLLLEYYKPEELRSYRNMDAIKRSFANFLRYDDDKVKQIPLR